MIKLIDVLRAANQQEERLFISWDAASWHASRRLKAKEEAVNKPPTGGAVQRHAVILAPLPASAQFLNVIESVFSGLCKAIIHNSDYNSAEECKNAINRNFRKGIRTSCNTYRKQVTKSEERRRSFRRSTSVKTLSTANSR